MSQLSSKEEMDITIQKLTSFNQFSAPKPLPSSKLRIIKKQTLKLRLHIRF